MKKVVTFILVIALCVICACSDDADDNVGVIHGTVKPTEGVEVDSLNGIDVYLYEFSNPFTGNCIDSTKTDTDQTFSFSNLKLGTYLVSLKAPFTILKYPDFIHIEINYTTVTIEYDVEPAEDD